MQIPVAIATEPRARSVDYPKEIAFYEVNWQFKRRRILIRLATHIVLITDKSLTVNRFMVKGLFWGGQHCLIPVIPGANQGHLRPEKIFMEGENFLGERRFECPRIGQKAVGPAFNFSPRFPALATIPRQFQPLTTLV